MNYDRPALLDRLAAEYVLGTMTARARRRFERLRRTLPAADAAARDWERRTAPLATVVPVVRPSAALWDRIERRLPGEARVERARSGWLDWLKPALGLAFGVLATIGVVRTYPGAVLPIDEIAQSRPLAASYVGLLTDRAGAPVVLASSARHGRTMTIKMLKPVDVPAGKVLQLWALPASGPPFPLGVVPSSGKGSFEMGDTSERLLSNVPRLGVTVDDGPARADAVPGDFLLTGHCVKLW